MLNQAAAVAVFYSPTPNSTASKSRNLMSTVSKTAIGKPILRAQHFAIGEMRNTIRRDNWRLANANNWIAQYKNELVSCGYSLSL